MKKQLHLLTTLVFAIIALSTLHAQTVEDGQKAAVKKHPTLAQAGSPLNQRFLAFISRKRQTEPAFFAKSDWPVRAADAVAEQMRAEGVIEQQKTKAMEVRSAADQEKAAEISKWELEWEKEKPRWIFERLVFGDSEETIIRKLNLSKILATRAAGSTRVDLSSRYRWIFGESKFNLEVEMKKGLAALTFESRPESTAELESLIREDWEKIRAAAVAQFGPPTKSAEFPTAGKLTPAGLSPTDEWARPNSHVVIGITQEAGKCRATLRISDPAQTANPPRL